MEKLILLLFLCSAYYVLAKNCKEGQKVTLQKGLVMRCKNNIWIPKQKRAGPGGPPCEDNPALEADGTCSALKGDCLQFTEKGEEMDRDCPGTCGSCDNCKCQDSSQWNQYCSFWTNFCASPGVLGTWMTTNCRKTCGHCSCKCCSYNGKQHSLGARIPISDKCGELVCQEGLVAGSSPLLPGAAQHPVSHPEQLTLIFRSLHTGDGCCILPINAVGGDGNNVGNGTMVAEGWKGTTNTENESIKVTCCRGSLQVPLEDVTMVPDKSTTDVSATTTKTTTTTTTTTDTTTDTATTTTTTKTATYTETITGPHADIELRGGSNSREGNVFIDDQPVCDDGWGLDDARVVCRMLGFGVSSSTSSSRFGNVPTNFMLDDVACNGNELSIFACGHRAINTHNCGAHEGAGVICV